MADVSDIRLKRLDAEYAAVIAASGQGSTGLSYERIDVIDDSCNDSEEHSSSDQPSTTTPSIEIWNDAPLTDHEVSQIKSHMSSIHIKHKPRWAGFLTDEKLVQMCQRMSHE
jgi:hypothetical protein